MSSIWRTSASLICRVIWFFSACAMVPQKDIRFSTANQINALLVWRVSLPPVCRRFSWFADTPHHGLDQAVDTFFFVSVHDAESEFGLVLGPLADANGQLSAEIVFDERCLVAAFLRIPGVHPQRAEVACRALRTARRGQEVLWFVSGGIRDAIQLKPGHGADVCRRRAFSHGIRQIQFDKAGNHPA